MWDYYPPPFAQIYICMYLILIPYFGDVIILFMGMFGRRMEGMYVPYGREIIHVHYAACFSENIGQTMFVSFELLSPYGMDYLHLMRTLEEEFMEG